MRRGISLLVLVPALAAALACTGNGSGLPTPQEECSMPEGSLPFPPRLSCLQQNVFTPACATSGCHSGAAPRVGLDLEEGKSYAALVNIPCVEQPALFRVKPGDPPLSYLVRKVEGGPAISGAQMPLNATPLTTAERAVLRAWIASGAPDN